MGCYLYFIEVLVMSRISILHKARLNQNDEFYTLYEDVEKELNKVKDRFKDKVIYCPCDNYKTSAFVKYFKDNFKSLGLKKLIATYYNPSGQSEVFTLSLSLSLTDKSVKLEGNGDFRSIECLKFFKEADIVVTNPPFSLFIEIFNKINDLGKDYVLVGHITSLSYKDVFKKYTGNRCFLLSHRKLRFYNTETIIPCVWLTSFEYINAPFIELTKTYNKTDYPKFANYDAINVNGYKDIPKDYDGIMGVPITILAYWNREQFDIIGISKTWDNGLPISMNYKELNAFGPSGELIKYNGSFSDPLLEGKPKNRNFYQHKETGKFYHAIFTRVFIKRK